MTHSTKQYSPLFLHSLNQNIDINGGSLKIALLKTLIDATMLLGVEEHSGDWDPFTIVTLNNNQTIEGAAGYPEFEIGDFNSGDDQFTPILHHTEITNILLVVDLELEPNVLEIEGVKLINNDIDDGDCIQISIPLEMIKSISINR